MNNKAPGAPGFVAIGFQGGNHGKFLTSLATSSNSSAKNGVSTHDWPIAPFPLIKYPYEEFYNENIKEENRCVAEVEKIIKNNKVAALIIEPIQIDGGIRYASPLFYRNLLELCYAHNVSFIADETRTSGWVTGRPFAYTHWNSEKSPHIVTFGGRMQISGLYYHNSYRPKVGGVVASTWNGDPVKILLFNRLHDVVHNKDWIDAHCPMFSQSVKSELFHLQRLTKFKISNIRGVGKIFAFDVIHKNLRNEIVLASRNAGYKVLPLNDTTIGFTPSLMFAEFHFTHFKNFLQNYQPISTYFG